MIIWLLLLVIIGFLFWAVICYEKTRRVLSHINGPPTIPIIGNAHQLGITPEDLLNNSLKYSQEYKRFCRIILGPFKSFILFKDPADIEVILSNTTNLKKGDVYLVVKPWLGEGLLTATGSHWRNHRKLITPAFHFGILGTFVPIFETNAEIYCNNLRVHLGDASFNVYNYTSLLALDNMIETGFGITLSVQRNQESEYLQTVRDVLTVMMTRSKNPWLYPKTIFDMTKDGKFQAKSLDILRNFTKDIIKKKKFEKKNHKIGNFQQEGGEKKRLAFMDLLLDIQERDPTFTDVDVREETDTFVFEGHDTTTSAISFCLYAISRHPQVQEKIVEELDKIFEGSDRKANYRDLQEMHYLERTIKETLRIFPSVPMIVRLAEEDIYLKDQTVIPKGIDMVVFLKSLGMNPEIWPNPTKFDPDRFLIEAARSRHPFAFAVFSAGPRNCIGQKFAILEMKSTVSTVIRKFLLKDAGHEVQLTNEITLKSINGIHIGIEERPRKKK